jgi:hypothetical protein
MFAKSLVVEAGEARFAMICPTLLLGKCPGEWPSIGEWHDRGVPRSSRFGMVVEGRPCLGRHSIPEVRPTTTIRRTG